ncbi:hypothetical protein P280DRAFT_58848 [Massarina eburnea CBS 473.64]|uniref:SART-1 protein n=1 Tax=Massarina eburnea CBS 473.64 TaxID=1395130 RepID=A0A6A6RUQ6_9PLEO|nr:hypothetical protein P280DRAFT_58848 [Massarina eburnea CBS 473.64]
MADLSIEEANKIRASMGMAPLPVPGAAAPPPSSRQTKTGDDSDDEPASTVETRQAAAHDNWQKLQDEQAAAKKKADRLEAIKKEREKASRFAKLKGQGLADIEDEDDMAWLKGSKKRAKKIAKAEQMERELEERERQAREAMQYTESDLAGVKVGHEAGQFDDEDQILVLKDTAVDGEDDDELEAVSLREKERLQEKLDSKKRKRAYDPNDEEGQTSILAQYDEEIDGKKRKAFTLDGQGRTVEDVQAEAAGVSKPKRVAISLDILNDDKPSNDYMDISEVKMKKPKKKKSKASKRQRVADEDDMFAGADEPADEMEVDDGMTVAAKPRKKKISEDQSFIDDDDLQATLAKQRREALKKRRKTKPEDIARQLREEAASPPQSPDVMDSTELLEPTIEVDPELVIDETTEFVQNLDVKSIEQEEARKRQRRATSRVSNGTDTVGVGEVDEEGDVDMGYAEVAEAEERSNSRARSTGIAEPGIEAEKTLDQGMGAALGLLRQRGMWSSEGVDKNASYRDRQKFLADKQRAEESAERLRKEQRERERHSARWATMTAREREEWSRKNNVNADQMESRKLADIFNKEYKPNIDLNYVDEHGRHLNQKEAFKMLSHQFHGKGSGNTKTKKHLDKIAGEKRKLAENSLDTTTGGLGNAHDGLAKKRAAAGIRMQ